MGKIKNIVFDIGNVLAEFRWRPYITEDLGLDPAFAESVKKRLMDTGIWDELDLSIQPREQILAHFRSEVKGWEAEFDRFMDPANLGDMVESYAYSRPWVQELKDRGYPVYLLSNYPDWIFDLHESQGRFSFTSLADGRVVSGFEKVCKPDPRIYRILFERYGLNPAECVFTDDREDNVEVGAGLGMRAFVFRSYEDAHRQMDRILEE